MEMYPVSDLLNSSRNDTSDLLKPLEAGKMKSADVSLLVKIIIIVVLLIFAVARAWRHAH
jgi:uncharacterized integral membrane protein